MNKNQIQQFHNEEFGNIRVVEIEGQPWFICAEVCKALGYTSNPRDTLSRHVDKEDRNTVVIHDGIRGNPNMTVINESGLYSLILSSKLPSAKKFKRWITSEVLPSLRKHGAYINPELLEQLLRNSELTGELLKKLQAEQERSEIFRDAYYEAAPKAFYCDDVLQSFDTIPVSVIAKDYGLGAAAFNKLLHALGVQYNVAGTWLLYQKYADQGYTESYTYYKHGEPLAVHTKWTQKGRRFIYELLKACGMEPRAHGEAA
jgi:prophage antirepressor-like protein